MSQRSLPAKSHDCGCWLWKSDWHIWAESSPAQISTVAEHTVALIFFNCWIQYGAVFYSSLVWKSPQSSINHVTLHLPHSGSGNSRVDLIQLIRVKQQWVVTGWGELPRERQGEPLTQYAQYLYMAYAAYYLWTAGFPIWSNTLNIKRLLAVKRRDDKKQWITMWRH